MFHYTKKHERAGAFFHVRSVDHPTRRNFNIDYFQNAGKNANVKLLYSKGYLKSCQGHSIYTSSRFNRYFIIIVAHFCNTIEKRFSPIIRDFRSTDLSTFENTSQREQAIFVALSSLLTIHLFRILTIYEQNKWCNFSRVPNLWNSPPRDRKKARDLSTRAVKPVPRRCFSIVTG